MMIYTVIADLGRRWLAESYTNIVGVYSSLELAEQAVANYLPPTYIEWDYHVYIEGEMLDSAWLNRDPSDFGEIVEE